MAVVDDIKGVGVATAVEKLDIVELVSLKDIVDELRVVGIVLPVPLVVVELLCVDAVDFACIVEYVGSVPIVSIVEDVASVDGTAVNVMSDGNNGLIVADCVLTVVAVAIGESLAAVLVVSEILVIVCSAVVDAVEGDDVVTEVVISLVAELLSVLIGSTVACAWSVVDGSVVAAVAGGVVLDAGSDVKASRVVWTYVVSDAASRVVTLLLALELALVASVLVATALIIAVEVVVSGSVVAISTKEEVVVISVVVVRISVVDMRRTVVVSEMLVVPGDVDSSTAVVSVVVSDATDARVSGAVDVNQDVVEALQVERAHRKSFYCSPLQASFSA